MKGIGKIGITAAGIIMMSLMPVWSLGQITFQKVYGHFYGASLEQTTDSGFIITGGYRDSASDYNDVYLIKTDIYGDILWTKTFGGIYSDDGKCVQQTTDGGFIILGSSESFSVDGIYLIKTDSTGNIIWSKIIGGTYSHVGYSIKQTTDGGYIITGYIQSSFSGNSQDVYLVKTDATGNLIWSKAFGGSARDEGYSVQQTSDGGFIIAGLTGSFGVDDTYLIKTDSVGNLVWSKVFVGDGNETYAQQTNDGGYIISGNRQSPLLIKTDVSGNPIWIKKIEILPYSESNYVEQTTDGGYIISGIQFPEESIWRNALSIKTDSTGNLNWIMTYGGPYDDQLAYMAKQTTDKGFVITGAYGAPSLAGVYLIKTDSMGNSGCIQQSSFAPVYTFPTSVINASTAINSASSVIITPVASVSSSSFSTTLCTSLGIPSEINNPESAITIFPNPSPNLFSISTKEEIQTIEVYSYLGEKVFASEGAITAIDLTDAAAGIYFYSVRMKDGTVASGKMVKEK
jgi:hypothetical protein